MIRIAAVCLMLCGTAIAAESSFPLGIDFSARLGFGDVAENLAMMMAADAKGALYLVGSGLPDDTEATVLGTDDPSRTYLMKLSPGAGAIEYLTVLGFLPSAMTVDPSGGVYFLDAGCVRKLAPDGTKFAYRFCPGDGVTPLALTVDSTGHAFIAGRAMGGALQTSANAFQPAARELLAHAFVAKLNQSGSGFEYATYLSGSATEFANGVAVNEAGEAFVIGGSSSADFPVTTGVYQTKPSTISTPFLARVKPDGSGLVYATFTSTSGDRTYFVRVDRGGRAVIYQGGVGVRLLRFSLDGTTAASTERFPSYQDWGKSFDLDSEGNAHLSGFMSSHTYPVRNTLSACPSQVSAQYLTVVAPSGEIVQSTYLPFSSEAHADSAAMVLGPDSTVYVVGRADQAFVATSEIEGMGNGSFVLVRLAPGRPVPRVQLACMGTLSGNTFTLAPGQMVSLTGDGLGPIDGATGDTGSTGRLPKELGGIDVTFGGTPVPLLYAGNTRIDAIAPWSLKPGTATEVCVHINGVSTNCLEWDVHAAGPSLFQDANGGILVWNEDGTVNSARNRAKAGTLVAVLASGLGPLDPMPEDGAILSPPLPRLMLPVRVLAINLSGRYPKWDMEEPELVGPLPFHVAGVYEIDFRVSSSNDMYITVGDGAAESGTGVFRVAVQ